MSEPYPVTVYTTEIHYPGDDFVGYPFHFVLSVVLGLITARCVAVDRLVSVISFLSLVYSTEIQANAYAEAWWREKPAAKVTQSDVTEYLTFSLVRSTSLLLFSSSLCKLIYKLLPTDITSLICRMDRWLVVGISLCFMNLLFDGAELKNLRPIINDRSIYFYLYASRIVESLRATLQG